MSKTKTKRARRELKRDGARKIAAHHRTVAKAAEASKPTPTTSSNKSTPGAKRKAAPGSKSPATKSEAAKPATQASQKHAVPFGEYEHILLVGEGDFSFTRSLAVEHGCANVTGTSFDSATDVAAKYSSFAGTKAELEALTPPVPIHHGIDATRVAGYKALRCAKDAAEKGANREAEGWDVIAFMFPHTGGLSTDVNRQVRANQALLVSFFKSCLDTPTPKHRLALLASQGNSVAARPSHPPFLRMSGRIIVTLFENEPYTLWNVRDLARHAGLKVVESWKFDRAQYPGYKHVRTLGEIEGGGGWKGEDREARMYVFEKIPLVADEEEEKELRGIKRKGRGGALPSQKQAAKRAREEEDDEED